MQNAAKMIEEDREEYLELCKFFNQQIREEFLVDYAHFAELKAKYREIFRKKRMTAVYI